MIKLSVNGKSHSIDVESEMPLLWVLRDELKLAGTKYGCGIAQCGACTVHVDGEPVRSCVTPVGSVAGKKVVTIEGLAAEGRLHPMQQAFIEEGAMQCGYCVPGMILAAKALLDRVPSPTEPQIVEGLNSNLCRCSGYPRIIAAVRRAARPTGGA